jgi:hypothetical protein
MGSVEPTRTVLVIKISALLCGKRVSIVKAIAKAAATDEQVEGFFGSWLSELNMPTRPYNVGNGQGFGCERFSLMLLSYL